MKRLTKRQRSVLRKWHADPGTAYTNATAIEWGIAKKLARRGYFDGCVSDRSWPLRYRWPGFWRITPKGLAAL